MKKTILMRKYITGIFDDPTCPISSPEHHHAVLVVGYGTDSATGIKKKNEFRAMGGG